MKRRFVTLVIMATTVAIVGCSRQSSETPAEKSTEPESHVKQGTNGEVFITLDAATQKVMGLEVAALAVAQLTPEVKGFGRVVDPAVLSVAVADYVSARATAEASQKDLARLKTLAEQSNASTRALETADAAARRDAAQAASARARLLAATGKPISEREDLATLIQSLTTGERALVRIDLPAGEAVKGEPTGARLVMLADDNQPIEASFGGATSVVDPQMQGRGFLFLVESNQSRLVPGVAITGFLKLPGDAQSGILVPRSAVVRFNGATWIYLQTGNETFQRIEVALERPLTDGWFVRQRLKPQYKIVVVGAQQLLSEELKGQIGGD